MERYVYVATVDKLNCDSEICFVADSEEKIPSLCKEVILDFQHYEGKVSSASAEEISESQWFVYFTTGHNKHLIIIDKLILNELKPMC